ncbi:interleukin 17a/f2 [Clinocottus analis]|uniref:interleukin 17a/f2 n=1 Tax=Clinocottus analis TaxID=304258 RepID=UPI0035C1ED35
MMSEITRLHKRSRLMLDEKHGDDMKLRGNAELQLVCCSVLWVVVSSSPGVTAPPPPPPRCSSTLTFSSEVASYSEGNGNINLRSLSPWTWRSSTSSTRIPSTLWEAECSGGSCSGLDGGLDLISVPIYQNILVLTRRARGRCFVASYRSVAVGCTCARAQTVQN